MKPNKPKPTGMSALLCALCVLAWLTNGCTIVHYRNETTHFNAVSFLDNNKLSKLSLDKRTRAFSQGMSLGEFSGAVDDAAVEAITKGMTEAILKSLIPLP